jgi:hypothetical protein
MGPCLVIDGPVEHDVWLKTAAQFRPSVLVHCCDDLAMHQIAICYGYLWQIAP